MAFFDGWPGLIGAPVFALAGYVTVVALLRFGGKRMLAQMVLAASEVSRPSSSRRTASLALSGAASGLRRCAPYQSEHSPRRLKPAVDGTPLATVRRRARVASGSRS